jgi:hypothetical protein
MIWRRFALPSLPAAASRSNASESIKPPSTFAADRTVQFDFCCSTLWFPLCQRKMTEPFGQQFVRAGFRYER